MLAPWWVVILAYLLDWVLADPYSWPHPVKGMGHLINLLTSPAWLDRLSPVGQGLWGGMVWTIVVGLSGGGTYLLLEQLGQFAPYWRTVVEVYLTYTCFSMKGLIVESSKVKQALEAGGVAAGRQQVAMIVGRETTSLSESEIIKATIETVAENTSDGFVAPLCFICLGGPAAGLVYKAVNTLDSMLGYRDERFRYLGWVSAKMDDLCNLLPARLNGLGLVLASGLLGMQPGRAWKVLWRDRYQHASPNAGWCEAPVAGSLGIQLGGAHRYHGVVVEKPTIGDESQPVTPQMIDQTQRLAAAVSLIAVGLSVSILILTY